MKRLALAALCALPLFAAGELSNRRAPGFSLPDSTMKQHDLADYRGKIVVVEFIQTACKTCQSFSAVLEKALAKYPGRVAGLSIVNPPDTMATVTQYIRDFSVTVPVLFDCGQVAASYLKVSPQRPTIHLPHIFVIDRDGAIRNDFGDQDAGALAGPDFLAELEKLLKK